MPNHHSLRLPHETFQRAAAFLQTTRPLEQAQFTFHFEQSPAAAVAEQLAAFQNADGGFTGLEADFGAPVSSVLSTCHALRILQDIGAGSDHPLVLPALRYLVVSYDQALNAWPIIPPHDNSHPHAPWWHYSENFAEQFGRFQDNPRPDALGCLYAFPIPATEKLRTQVTRAISSRLNAASEDVEMHGLVCYVRLHRAPGLPDELRALLARRLPGWIDRGVERDPAKWTGYGLRPLDVAPDAASPWHEQLAPDIARNLDFLIAHQAPDGSWMPHWSWGDAFPQAWEASRRKWQAVLTLGALRTLRSYGRLET